MSRPYLYDSDVVKNAKEGTEENCDRQNDEHEVVVLIIIAIQELGPDLRKAQELHDHVPHTIKSFETHWPFKSHLRNDKLRGDERKLQMNLCHLSVRISTHDLILILIR